MRKSIVILFIGVIFVGLFVFALQKESTKYSIFGSLVPQSYRIYETNNDNLITEKKSSIWVPILNYHYIRDYNSETDSTGNSLSISPQVFEEQIKQLLENKYTSITMDDLYMALVKKNKLPEKPVILTFDDGYQDFYENAYPILKKYNIKAIVYVIVGKIGDKDQRYLTWNQVIELDRNGLVTIGSHSMSHANLEASNNQKLYREIYLSKKELEKILGHSVDHFCYPSGKYNQSTINLTKASKYKTAVTTELGSRHLENELYTLRRERISGGISIEQFKQKISPEYTSK